ncbi:MAG: CPXCG motif-containing cysteine-rich protein [Planctomycetota bacterium]
MESPWNESDSDSIDDETIGQAYDEDGSYICDQCGEEIVIPLDPAAGRHQSYVEDCPVCCCPNLIHVDWDDAHASVRAEPEQDRY